MKRIIDYIKSRKNMFLVIGVILLITIAGTLAWLTWQSKETALVLKVGEVDGLRVTLYPYQIKEEISSSLTSESEVFTTIEAKNNSSKTQSFELSYKIKEIDDDLKGDLKYSLVKENSDGTTVSVKTGSFSDISSGEELIITTLLVANKTTDNYKLYLWLDGESENVLTDSKAIINAELGVEILEYKSIPNAPNVVDGLIPVTLSNDGTVTTISKDDDNWYDYDEKEWANAVLVTETNRSIYQDSTGVTIPEDDILAYYVWIPRYKYKIWTTGTSSTGEEQEIDIVFENISEISAGTQVGEYITHPAFWWDSDSDGVRDEGEELSGIWVGKFETSTDTSSACYTSASSYTCDNANQSPRIKPNVYSLRYQKISNQFQTILKFSEGTLSNGIVTFTGSSTYGLNSTVNSHMLKNSEWGAVAYLSHSKYGIGTEIRINNNNSYTTGCGALAANAGSSSSCEIAYGSGVTEYPQSTTGNITGIFDMSGGVNEYVMGNYNETNGSSGFSTFPEGKYYDKYTTTSSLTACNGGVCYGHALSETNKWYSNIATFVSASYPWFYRDGLYTYVCSNGLSDVTYYNTSSKIATTIYFGFRAALIQEGV